MLHAPRVAEELDLSAILASYRGEKGRPPYHPAMMVVLLLHTCAVGRHLLFAPDRQSVCGAVDFMAIVALDGPDFRTPPSCGAVGAVGAGAIPGERLPSR